MARRLFWGLFIVGARVVQPAVAIEVLDQGAQALPELGAVMPHEAEVLPPSENLISSDREIVSNDSG